MNSSYRINALALAGEIADTLVLDGAAAVVLMGSFARGDAGPFSDLDLLAIGEGPSYLLEQHEGQLIAISWSNLDEINATFAKPERAGYLVQGWRDARILRDPEGIAARIQQHAQAWGWSHLVECAADRSVAEEICGLAEEVHKLVGLLASGNLSGAAVQRSILSYRIGTILAVHLRLLYATENELWNLVGERLDGEWESVQARALGLGDEDFRTTCSGALQLYRLAVALVHPLFDERQKKVVDHAVAIATTLLEDGSA